MSHTGIRMKRAPFAALLVAAVLLMSSAVARAATPAISGVSASPAGHFAGACSGCHVVEPVVPEVRAPRTPDASALVARREPVGPVAHTTTPVAVVRPDARAGEHPTAAGRDAGAAGGAHETVSSPVRERTKQDPHPSDQGDTRPHSGDHGDASQREVGGAGHGSSR